MDAYELPDGSITIHADIAAERWADAFYQAKDALTRIRPIPDEIIMGRSVRDLDEICVACDSVLRLGVK